ncbi:MAG: glutathione S-transferase [Gammaproteobacteria bacterium]|nr:glutathione S-transferase [Gammaproteobacteria bacterium]
MKLVIGNQTYSSWSMRPWLFMVYHDLEAEIEKLSLNHLPLIQKRFTHGKVPVLIDGLLEIWDSLAILEYLSETYPDTQGWPEEVNARAVARSVSAEMHSSFQALRSGLPMNCRKFFPEYQLSNKVMKDVKRIQQIWNFCRERYAATGPWLFGRFGIADSMYAPVVMRFLSINIELDLVSQEYCHTVCQCDAVKRWLAEAFQETEIVSEDELHHPSISLLDQKFGAQKDIHR